MFSVVDGKRKFIYNYKALESLKLKLESNKNVPNNFLIFNNNGSSSYTKIFSYNKSRNIFNGENTSKFFNSTKKEINKIKKQLLSKKVDILLNKAFDKCTNIRHYNSYKDSIHLTNKIFPRINCKGQSKDKTNLFKSKVKNIILRNFNDFFPEKYINSRERATTNVEKKNNIIKMRKKFEEKNKLCKIKYVNKEPMIESQKVIAQSKEEKLINKLILIYNEKNKRKLFINTNKNKIDKKFDAELKKNTNL